ncbi:hypothetical protein PsYK624_112720 [Phanerochaete sordida]|uniref:Uncharacterized protein n=1 Tax=Phanerochaete sordida TaxID=48140 RepID=A0A9P3GGB6_9APHY|nr:hypothetical protein PsYK624_112720 [Phanerochaete sordida]
MDDALPTPVLPLPPTCWATVSSCADPNAGMSMSNTINSFIDGSSGLLTDTTFHERQHGMLRTEFTSHNVVSTHYPLYYFEVTVHSPTMNGLCVIPGVTYSCGGSAAVSRGYYEIRLARVLSTHNCKSGDKWALHSAPDGRSSKGHRFPSPSFNFSGHRPLSSSRSHPRQFRAGAVFIQHLSAILGTVVSANGEF